MPSHAPLRVLVVDDFQDGRDAVIEFLTFHGFAVMAATNGAEAIAIARRECPDVILMDLEMPVLNGWEATRQLKADPATQNLFVVALTAHALRRETDLARQAGCDAIVSKPFDFGALAKALRQVGTKGARVFDVPGLNAHVRDHRTES